MKNAPETKVSEARSESNNSMATTVAIKDYSFIIPWKERHVQLFTASLAQESILQRVLFVACAVDMPHSFESYRTRIPVATNSNIDDEAKAATRWMLRYGPDNFHLDVYFTGNFDTDLKRELSRFKSVSFESVPPAENPAYLDLRQFMRTQGIF
jgi:hypothetical protein